MESVMMAIEPERCVKIASGEKTIEWRKSHPTRTSGPFKVYIYCTSIKRMSLETYVDLHRKTGGRIDSWSGKIIGEFMCYGFYPVRPDEAIGQLVEKRGCVPDKDLRKYFGGHNGFGWNIADLKMYALPKEISELHILTDDGPAAVKKPPQSWCYVEDLT